MLQVCLDLRDEADELHAFLKTLDDADWQKPTLFMDWTPWDVVAHLHFFDELSVLAAKDPDAFLERRKALIEGMASGVSGTQQTREHFEGLAVPALVERWHRACHEMAEELGASDPKRRLPWFGPDMGVQMFTTARYMETWAHAQELYDLKKAPRTHTDRIKHICVIGVKTFGWTFINRNLEVPGDPPYVRLVAPSGAIWEFGEPSESERVSGTALDFCQTVTQVRNVQDTGLEVVGEVANRWMEIAQCFAGGAVDPPEPGTRVGA